MVKRLLLTIVLVGCADAEEPAASIDAGRDTAVADTGARDTAVSDAPSDSIFPVEDVGPTGICATPTGTTVTASAAHMSTPDMVVDGTLSTVWNSGGYSGWVRLTFPKPTLLDRLRIAANALPDCDHVYTIKGTSGGSETTIGTATRSVTGENKFLPPIEVARGTYDELLVEIAPTASWIALGEIVVYDSTAGCPVP
jgi:hypothetical protein